MSPLAAPADFPLARTRADTPGCQGVVHLNNAGCSLPTQSVLDTQLNYLRLEATVGGYEAVAQESERLEATYTSLASLLKVEASEVALTGGASESWWRAFQATGLQPGDRVLATRHEFVSGGIALAQAREAGVDVCYVPDDADGLVDLDSLERELEIGAKLVCLTNYPMTNGLINPTADVGELTKRSGALLLVDATQGIGQASIEPRSFHADFVTGTGRKWLRAMRGVGILYVRGDLIEQLSPPSFIDGSSASWTGDFDYRLAKGAKRYELGERPIAAQLALGVAIDYALDLGLHAIEGRVRSLASKLRADLKTIDAVVLNDVGTDQSGIVTFNVSGHQASAVAAYLGRNGINVGSPGTAASLVDLSRQNIPSVVRASAHYYNTEAELHKMVELLAAL